MGGCRFRFYGHFSGQPCVFKTLSRRFLVAFESAMRRPWMWRFSRGMGCSFLAFSWPYPSDESIAIGSDLASRKCAATTESNGLALLVFASDRFAASACVWPCLASCNDSPCRRSNLCGAQLSARPLCLRRCGCFLAPCGAFGLRLRREGVAGAGRRRGWRPRGGRGRGGGYGSWTSLM